MKQPRIRIRSGLDIPLKGQADPRIEPAREPQHVALMGFDYPGVKARLDIAVGDRVALGAPLFHDKRRPEIHFTAPGAGQIAAINLGPRRSLRSVVIKLEGDEALPFEPHARDSLSSLDREAVVAQLLASGLWTALRTRPFSRIPDPDAQPAAIVVNAADSNPLAIPATDVVVAEVDAFSAGLVVLQRLSAGPVHVACADGAAAQIPTLESVPVTEFAGPHPSGLVGTHIHFLVPVNAQRSVWHLNAQDVIAMGKLFVEGRLAVKRVVTLAGPMATDPRRVTTRLGASLDEILQGEIRPGHARVVSGSPLNGHRAHRWSAFLGRYHQQISVLTQNNERQFMSYMRLGVNQYSSTNAFASAVLRPRDGFDLRTTFNGSRRAMVPIGNLEGVMPLDMLPAPLLKSLIVRDTDTAQALGCLELDEEDLALASFVCPSKYDYGLHLRECLDLIERDG